MGAKWFIVVLILLDLAAAIAFAFEPDWRRSVYWLCAAILSAVVTF